MKKIIFAIILTFCVSTIYSQSVKHFSTYVKPVNGETRFATVLSDNTIYWCDPNDAVWNKVATINLPAKFEVKCFSTYIKSNGDTRFGIVLADNTLWWADPNDGNWTKVPTSNLPAGFNIKAFSTYVKPNGDSRFAITLETNTMYWASPNDGIWTEVSTKSISK